MIGKIVKRDGRIVDFNKSKIIMAILQAAVAVGGRNKETAEAVTQDVITFLKAKTYKQSFPTVEEIQDYVEKSLIKKGHAKTAKAFILYRYEQTLKRAGKENLTYSHDNIPYKKLWQALSWGVDNNCVSIPQLNSIITKDSFPELIDSSEKFFNNEIEQSLSILLKRIDKIKIIVIAGPSSSGKTTTTIKLKNKLENLGYRLVALNVDNYFYNLTEHPQDSSGDYDFETPQALELSLIREHLEMLLDGKKVSIPKYNFNKGKRDGISQNLKLQKKDIILIDSLHGMFPEMTNNINEKNKFKLYIETLSQLKTGNNQFIRWTDIRMLRRIIRDSQFRNTKPEQTIKHWHYVRRSELRYIVSHLKDAHGIVNSFLTYELPIMKYKLNEIISSLFQYFNNKKNPGNEDAMESEDALERVIRIKELFNELLPWQDDTIIPDTSLLREFIGKSSYQY